MSFTHFHFLTNQFSASFLISEDKHYDAPPGCDDSVFSLIISVSVILVSVLIGLVSCDVSVLSRLPAKLPCVFPFAS